MPPSGDDAVQQVRSRVDVVDVVSDHVRLSKRGRDLWGLCPFHDEKTPSFKVNQQMQSWYCFGCQEGGDVFDFIEKLEKVEFRDALRILAERAGVELQQQDPRAVEAAHRRRRILDLNKLAAQYYEYVLHELPAGEPGRQVLSDRAVTTETAKRFQLGYAPAGKSFADYLRSRQKPIADAIAAGLLRRDGRDFFQERLLIPIRDERGQTVAFTGRTVRADEVRKYVNTPETPAYHKGRVLFALDMAREEIGKAGHAVLMEGQFDVITGHQRGVTNAVASSGTALTDDQVKLLKRFTDEAVLAFDGDTAGKQAAFKAVETASAGGLRTRVVQLDGAKDPDDFLRAAGDESEARWTAAVDAAPAGWEFRLQDAIAGLNTSKPHDLEVALQRVRAILGRIPDAALRATYGDLSARWLGVDGRLIDGRRPAPAPGTPAPPGPKPGTPKGTVEKQLLQVMAARPELALEIKSRIAPEDLPEDVRATFGKMWDALDKGGVSELQDRVPEFERWEQDLLRQAWASPPPGFDEDEVVEALIRRAQVRADERRRKGIISDLAEAERTGDLERAARLMTDYQQLSKRG
ncbi:MAG TPA: DNA primase [Candidatus Dormibacteraeota bacterium]